jgi:hypothetical protein
MHDNAGRQHFLFCGDVVVRDANDMKLVPRGLQRLGFADNAVVPRHIVVDEHADFHGKP